MDSSLSKIVFKMGQFRFLVHCSYDKAQRVENFSDHKGSPGLVVKGGGSHLKVVGSNPSAIYWMDMIFFTLICCKN